MRSPQGREQSRHSPEGNLDDTTELCELLCGVCLDVGDALKVGYEVLCDCLPCLESLDEDVGRAKVGGAWRTSR